MQQTWFKDWFNSPYYHQLYFKRDNKEAAAFIDNLIQYLQPIKGSIMLDVACGKGRHSIQLANKNFDVTGIDLSQESIEEALHFEKQNLHFYTHDMRLPFWINYFNYVFNFFTSFGYFKTSRENDNAIRTIAQALKKNGIFVMDYLNAPFVESHFISKMEKEIDDVKFSIFKKFDDEFFYKKIVINTGSLQEPLIFTEKVAKFSLKIFTEMFKKQGLQIIEVFGDYNFDNYDVKNSPRLIMIAQKL